MGPQKNWAWSVTWHICLGNMISDDRTDIELPWSSRSSKMHSRKKSFFLPILGDLESYLVKNSSLSRFIGLHKQFGKCWLEICLWCERESWSCTWLSSKARAEALMFSSALLPHAYFQGWVLTLEHWGFHEKKSPHLTFCCKSCKQFC